MSAVQSLCARARKSVSKFTIGRALHAQEIASCFPVLAELRPQLDAVSFVSTIQKLMAVSQFELAYLDDGGVKAVAGYRVSEWLHGGKYLEIEDLVAASSARFSIGSWPRPPIAVAGTSGCCLA